MPVIPSRSEVKAFLQIPVSTTTHDALIDSLIPAAVGTLERMSGRQISASSNVQTTYSTDGSSSLVIHDRPYTDPSRSVQLDGTTLTENQDVWFIQDRRDPNVTATIQLRQFTGSGEWWKADPDWFNKNLDIWARRWGESGMPNNLTITGIIGMPLITYDTHHAIIEMTGYLFKQKDAAGNVTFSPEGAILDIQDLPTPVQAWLINWRIRTAVSVI